MLEDKPAKRRTGMMTWDTKIGARDPRTLQTGTWVSVGFVHEVREIRS